ncbi:MAG TPA: hypothetical protein VNV41_00800 [Candidatus Acidoferrales bacterium]|jgi:hypothetical protein|nr:hypothetical protein [Candidatus Acidoferrales bacterium]
MNFKSLLVGIAIGIPMLIAGCGGGTNLNKISIAITTAPPASLQVNQTASMAATVTMDSSNSGVDWSCTPTGTCGTFVPTHTASGATTVYTAPATAGAVTIVAASTKNSSKTASASVTINNINVNNITIAITTAPPASLEVNQSASIAATVTMDSSNSGVDWSCTPIGTCGTFVPAHTASGGTTVYTAPRTAGPVTIIAASTANSAKTASASVTIDAVATASNITGTYTFFANGTDGGQAPISVAGSVVINGAMGTVTGGEQDYFDITSTNIFPSDPILSGSITVGADGRGTLVVTPTSAPAETYSITVVNNKHILITEFDSNATASGSLDLQTSPTSVPTGGNAFALFDATDANSFGGVLTSSGTAITASEADDDLGGVATFGFAITTGSSFTSPDANGRGTITLNDPNFGAFELAYYVVGPEAFRLIEFDGVGFATGSMYGQGTGAFSGASLGSKFVFGQAGVEAPGPTGLGIYSAAGQFTGNGTSALSSGVADVNLGDGHPKEAADLTAGTTYSISANGYGGITLTGATTDGLANFGVYMVDPTINVSDPNSASGGGGAVLLDLDASQLGVGIVVPQATSPTFVGNFAFSDDGGLATTQSSLFGLVGEVTSDGTSKVAGLGDYNELTIARTPAVTLAGTYTADAANPGRSTMPLTINGAAAPNNITLYQASSALVLHVDVDSPANQSGIIGFGVFEQQQ